ncbi:5-deoxy-glucuronate isomerase [Spiroplasma chinense]|uniref:5-deoxy-glucuronate isomerase n=1 Tax=Spiroplasma chinense TaxID=216932 RepID=A0A5B9Y4Y1_9MOLU|nr:5-deoxy-glucuronate isomerase [Spiroplasma chinense]QEH61843.1 5-deoxy-glucuronate isomerase [Spiroplasma chinense]
MYIKSTSLIEKDGFTEYCNTKTNFMNLDVGLLKLSKGEKFEFKACGREKAFDLLEGEIEIKINNDINLKFERASLFHDKPSVLLADKTFNIEITCLSEKSELIVQATHNEKEFGYKVWNKDDLEISISGQDQALGTCTRKVIQFFDYESFPESNMVMGEVICSPGQWASWPPHRHYQPEMYLFKFNKPEGFGVSFVGDDAIKVMNNDATCIPGQLLHPTVCAPGYIMWYCWMIPNLPNKPWVERSFDERYEWTSTNDVEISKMR